MRKRRDDANVRTVFKSDEEMANHQRACMIEKWMEKKVTEKIVVRGKPMADFQKLKMVSKDRQGSSSSSAVSSCRRGFSSSEAEYSPVIHRQKPVRAGGQGKSRWNVEDRRGFGASGDQLEQKSKHESGFLKTKSRALKIYGDLKKAKQPISPCGKVAAFWNSLFAAGNLKKPCGGDSPSLSSTCSSASSFSKSCLSKTSSKSSGGGKRSVRFSPVSVIHPCGQKSSHQVNSENNAIDEELTMDKNRRLEEAARDFLMNYPKKEKTGCEFELQFDYLSKTTAENRRFGREFDEDEDFDAASYASSDLFELDNLSAVGMERYREELPVYKSTTLDKIHHANGLVL